MPRRTKRTRKKFNLKKFFKDYPIVPVIAVVFTLGVWIGFGLGQKSITWKRETVKVVSEIREKASLKQALVSVVAPKPAAKAIRKKAPPARKRIEPRRVALRHFGPKIVFVIDDIGYSKREAELLFSIEPPLTLAVLPQLAYSKYFASEGIARGYETILHQPLEPTDPNDKPGVGEIRSGMASSEVESIFTSNLRTVAGARGVNNHMGSLATRDRALMQVILSEFAGRKLFFLDSLTHPQSIAYDTARSLGIPALKRDVFLDNEDDYDYITDQISETAKIARTNGSAVAIGHIRENTLRAIKDAIPKLEERGFVLTTLEDLL